MCKRECVCLRERGGGGVREVVVHANLFEQPTYSPSWLRMRDPMLRGCVCVRMCVRGKERESVCAHVRERKGERGCVCVRMCVRGKERVCVRMRAHVRERKGESVCVRMWGYMRVCAPPDI